jgi:cation transport ATPase
LAAQSWVIGTFSTLSVHQVLGTQHLIGSLSLASISRFGHSRHTLNSGQKHTPTGTLLRVPEYTYFDVTIVVIGFITLGKYLEARSKKKTGDAIEKLLNLQAKTALVIRNGKEVEVKIDEVVHGSCRQCLTIQQRWDRE